MNEQLINDRIRLDNITTEMNKISQVAREYMNASQEQRDMVDPQLLASVLDRYNTLKADKLALEQSVVAREMEAQRAATEQQAQQTYNGGGRRRTIVPRNNPDVNIPNPDVVVDNPSLPITIAYTRTGVPYYLDKTTGNQIAPTGYDANGNAVFANGQTLGNIQGDINGWINRYGTNAQLARDEMAARDNAEFERNKMIALNMMSVPAAMTVAEGIMGGALAGTAGAGGTSAINSNPIAQQALNNSYRAVQSNPLNYTRTLGTRNITRVPQGAINNTVNNAYRYVQSNPLDYNALRTIPSTLR